MNENPLIFNLELDLFAEFKLSLFSFRYGSLAVNKRNEIFLFILEMLQLRNLGSKE